MSQVLRQAGVHAVHAVASSTWNPSVYMGRMGHTHFFPQVGTASDGAKVALRVAVAAGGTRKLKIIL